MFLNQQQIAENPSEKNLLPIGCNVKDPNDSSCCNRKVGKCRLNEGHCTEDSQCQAGLRCGTNSNCPRDFPSNYSCCYKPPGTYIINNHSTFIRHGSKNKVWRG